MPEGGGGEAQAPSTRKKYPTMDSHQHAPSTPAGGHEETKEDEGQDHRMIKQAMYNTMCMAVAVLLGMVMYYNYLLISFYFTPVTWAIICSVPLRRIQNKVLSEIEDVDSCRSTAYIILRIIFDIPIWLLNFPWACLEHAFTQKKPVQHTRWTTTPAKSGKRRQQNDAKSTTKKKKLHASSKGKAEDTPLYSEPQRSYGEKVIEGLCTTIFLWVILSRAILYLGWVSGFTFAFCILLFVPLTRLLRYLLLWVPSKVSGLLPSKTVDQLQRLPSELSESWAVTKQLRLQVQKNRRAIVAIVVIATCLFFCLALTAWTCISALYECGKLAQVVGTAIRLPSGLSMPDSPWSTEECRVVNGTLNGTRGYCREAQWTFSTWGEGVWVAADRDEASFASNATATAVCAPKLLRGSGLHYVEFEMASDPKGVRVGVLTEGADLHKSLGTSLGSVGYSAKGPWKANGEWMQGPLDEGEGVGRAYEIGGRAYEIGDHVGVWLDATEGVARFTLNGEMLEGHIALGDGWGPTSVGLHFAVGGVTPEEGGHVRVVPRDRKSVV